MKRYADIKWTNGACAFGIEPEKFYPGERHQIDPQVLEWCQNCAIKAECAEWGIRHEAHGVWGGLSGNQRAMIRKRNGIRMEEPQHANFLPSKPIVMEMEPVREVRSRPSGPNTVTVMARVEEFHDTYAQHAGMISVAADVMGMNAMTLASYLRHAKNTLKMDVMTYRDDSYAARKRAQARRKVS